MILEYLEWPQYLVILINMDYLQKDLLSVYFQTKFIETATFLQQCFGQEDFTLLQALQEVDPACLLHPVG